MLVNMDLANLVRQNTLHGQLNGDNSNTRTHHGITDIVFIRNAIVTGNDNNVGPVRRAATEKAYTLICEWMRAIQILLCL